MRTRLIGGMLAALLSAGCATLATELGTALDLNPLALERALAQPADPQAEARALDAARQDEAQGLVARDARGEQRLNAIMQRLVRVSHKPTLNPVIRIIDDASINASVDPNGYVRVNRGLLEFTSSDDALAGVLGHELGHADAGHISRGMISGILSELAVYGAGRVVKGETAEQVIQTVGAAVGPAYSRKHEREADILGTIYARRAGYNPRALTTVFAELARQDAGEQYQLENALRQSYQRYEFAAEQYQAAAQAYNADPSSPMRQQQAVAAEQAAAQAEAQYVRVRQAYVQRRQATSPLLRDHPLDDERIETIIAVQEFVDGQRRIETLPPAAQTVIQTLAELEGHEGRLPPAASQAAASSALTKFCPAGGERYPNNVTECPVHHVKLRTLVR